MGTAWAHANRTKMNAAGKRWRTRNPDKVRAKLARRTLRNLEIVASLRARLCTDCGGKFHPAIMEFDHTPEHGRTLTCVTALTGGATGRLLDEIAKTEVVCANCHRMRTYARRLSA